jgi:hypothetical protein
LWLTESRKLTTLDYRLFDIQHAVLPTKLPLDRYYEELVKTQNVLNRKHLGWTALREVASIAARLALRGQFNFLTMLWKFNKVYNPRRQYAEHFQPVRYEMRPPVKPAGSKPSSAELYIHQPRLARPAPAAAAGTG